MKKVLVFGAAGNIGLELIKYLLSEGKYEITAVDLRNRRSHHNLKKYRRRINIVYGDMNDHILIDNLVAEHDYIYLVAGVIPPLGDLKKSLLKEMEYNGIKNVLRGVKAYKPEAKIIYLSTTSLYGLQDKVTVKTKPDYSEFDYYIKNKLDCEALITKSAKNYVIYRIPVVLGNFKNDFPIYNVKANDDTTKFDVITSSDCAYGLVKTIDNYDKVNNHIYNMTGGKDCLINIKEYKYLLLSLYGISFRYLFTKLFVPKNFYLNQISDADKLEDILHFRSETITSYRIRIKRSKQYYHRRIARLLAIPFLPNIDKEV